MSTTYSRNRVALGTRGACAAAAIFGVFIQAKVNPITPSCTMLVAILAGITYRGDRELSPVASDIVAAFVIPLLTAAAALLSCFYVVDLRM